MMSDIQTTLHPATRLGRAELRVANLERSLAFYEGLMGFQILNREDHSVNLGIDAHILLRLEEIPQARHQPAYSTGLYHVAILLPSRADLGRFVLHMRRAGYPFQGYADHLVSEAVYFADPDGNGLEVYRDLPREQWRWRGKELLIGTEPLDLDGVLAAAEDTTWQGIPSGTRIGHMHLRVSDLVEAEAFYRDGLGFELMTRYPGASFLAAGGYHHHLGLNIWQSRGASPPPENTVGLRGFTIVLPSGEALAQVAQNLDTAAIPYVYTAHKLLVLDPWGHEVVIQTEPL